MRSSKAQILSRVHTVPAIRFTDQTLTSASGLVLFQVLFDRLDCALGSGGLAIMSGASATSSCPNCS